MLRFPKQEQHSYYLTLIKYTYRAVMQVAAARKINKTAMAAFGRLTVIETNVALT